MKFTVPLQRNLFYECCSSSMNTHKSVVVMVLVVVVVLVLVVLVVVVVVLVAVVVEFRAQT